MRETVKLWFIAALLLMVPLIGSADTLEVSIADNSGFEQLQTDNFNAPEGETEVTLRKYDSGPNVSGVTLLTTPAQCPYCEKHGYKVVPTKFALYSNPEVGWHVLLI